MKEEIKKYEMKLDGKDLSFEINKLAKFANTSVLVRYGDTSVLTTITAANEVKEGIDFFPLSVDYEERLYSVGRIPGGYLKREGRPSEFATLTSRAIDRPMRPLFPEDLRQSVSISCLVLSVDHESSSEFAAMIGANLAAHISDVPFNGPIATVNVGLIDGKYILNPTEEIQDESKMYLTIAGSKDKIVMIEAGAYEVTNKEIMDGINFGHKFIKELCDIQEKIRSEIGKEKFEYEKQVLNEELYEKADKKYSKKIKEILDTYPDKNTLDGTVAEIKEEFKIEIKEEIEKLEKNITKDISDLENLKQLKKDLSDVSDVITELEKNIIRENIFTKKQRIDGRGLDEIRELSSEVGLFNNIHGSGLFARGETQVLSILSLGKISEQQRLDGVDPHEHKRYMHHYNFPGYSVGEARPSRGAGRREIGHGALAEKSLIPVLPSKEEFPYAIRVVSEVLGSNGSTSQASVCGSTLALMDGGVPIKKPVAGISTGLFTNKDGHIMVTDIQGTEDFFGDMDFKVAGTKDGITSVQVDIKIDGLTLEIVEEAFEKTEKARIKIIDEVILKTIKEPRKELAPTAPKIITIQIKPEKIGELIGKSGENINKIIEITGVEIDIEDDGLVLIYGVDPEKTKLALELVEKSVKEYEKGEVVTGKVVRIVNFGAFVQLDGGKEGLLHISKIDNSRVNNVEDVLKEGQEITVLIDGIDNDGKISLNRKDLFKKQ